MPELSDTDIDAIIDDRPSPGDPLSEFVARLEAIAATAPIPRGSYELNQLMGVVDLREPRKSDPKSKASRKGISATSLFVGVLVKVLLFASVAAAAATGAGVRGIIDVPLLSDRWVLRDPQVEIPNPGVGPTPTVGYPAAVPTTSHDSGPPPSDGAGSATNPDVGSTPADGASPETDGEPETDATVPPTTDDVPSSVEPTEPADPPTQGAGEASKCRDRPPGGSESPSDNDCGAGDSNRSSNSNDKTDDTRGNRSTNARDNSGGDGSDNVTESHHAANVPDQTRDR